MRKLVVVTVSALTLLGSAVGVAIADPNLDLTTSPHRHFINGKEVGPRLCDHPDSSAVRSAFTQFHANVHTHAGVTGEIGPEQPAPGLHNGRGGEISAGAC